MKRTQHKIPQESPDYPEISRFVVERISQIIRQAIELGNNKIFIHTNLRRGLPLENINKVAGPFVTLRSSHAQHGNFCKCSTRNSLPHKAKRHG